MRNLRELQIIEESDQPPAHLRGKISASRDSGETQETGIRPILGPEKKFQGSKEEADSVQRHEKLEKSFKKPRWCAAAAAADCAKS